MQKLFLQEEVFEDRKRVFRCQIVFATKIGEERNADRTSLHNYWKKRREKSQKTYRVIRETETGS